METRQERRVQRADDAAGALTHRLTRAREEAALEAVVLASEEGLLLARAGDQELCETLAALAPLLCLADGRHGSLAEEFRATKIAVRPFTVDGSPLFLAWSGGTPEGAWLDAANAGVQRILATC